MSALALVPAAVTFRLIITSWERLGLAALVIDLESHGGDLQPAVAQALEDPSLEVLTSPDGRLLLDKNGDEVSSDAVPTGRAVTRIQAGSRLVGALVHTALLRRNPARIQAVAAAAGMAMQVSMLNREVTAQLAEVDASRARILQASDTARRQVERDLHDGAQQRLVAIGLRLQRARRQASSADQNWLALLLEDATREVRDSIEDIRAVSRGHQPTLLAERGLTTAVDALAERAPIPVSIDITADPLPPKTEMTAYYVIAEGLTNMAKHARATEAEVAISRPNGVACVTIRDNGHGGARVTAGSGLEGLSDRGGRHRGYVHHLLRTRRHDAGGHDSVRVIIVDDSAVVRDGLAGLLADEGIEVIATFSSTAGVVEAVGRHQPDVLITDVRMPPDFETEGLEAALHARRTVPGTGILVYSQHIETRYAVELIGDGAAGIGYLLKDRVIEFDSFLDALHRVASGGSAIDPEVVTRLVRRPKSESPLDRLTEREREVLSLMAQGCSNAAISERLSVNQRTAETHVSNILTKLDLSPDAATDRRVSAVILWLRQQHD